MITTQQLSRTLTFAALTSLLAMPASAQKLILNDGTAAISGSGTQTGPGASFTFSGGAGPSTKSYKEVDASAGIAPVLTLKTGGSITNLQASSASVMVTGGNVQNSTNYGGDVTQTGGTIQQATNYGGLFSVQDGTLNNYTAQSGTLSISGGTVGPADTSDAGSINISGGTVAAAYGLHDGSVSISGGTVTKTYAGDLSTVSISGGEVSTASTGDGGTLNVFDGTVDTIVQRGGDVGVGGGTVNHISTIYTGALNSFDISGGKFKFIDNQTSIDLFGTNLKATKVSGSDFLDLLLTGTLTSGDTLNAQYSAPFDGVSLLFNGQAATISPAPVPEASTVVSFGLLLLLGFGVTARKARSH